MEWRYKSNLNNINQYKSNLNDDNDNSVDNNKNNAKNKRSVLILGIVLKII